MYGQRPCRSACNECAREVGEDGDGCRVAVSGSTAAPAAPNEDAADPRGRGARPVRVWSISDIQDLLWGDAPVLARMPESLWMRLERVDRRIGRTQPKGKVVRHTERAQLREHRVVRECTDLHTTFGQQ